MRLSRDASDDQLQKITVPDELEAVDGTFLKRARRELKIDRSKVSDSAGIDRIELEEFEAGHSPVTDELWRAYVRSVQDSIETLRLSAGEANSLLRGLVNEIRLYGLN
jgi:hypothetical protein